MSLKRFRANRFLLLLICAASILSANAQSTAIHVLTVDDAIALAKKNNLAVKTALINLQVQEQTNKAITAQALPDVSGNGSSTIFFKPPVTILPGELNQVNPGVPFPVSFQTKYTAGAGVQLNQTIFDGQVFVGLQARRTAIDYYKKAIDLTVESITVNVYKVYYQLVVSKTQIELLDANIARAAKLLKDTRAMFDNGFAERLDIDKATVQLANLETSKQNTETTIQNGYLGLKYLIGIPVSDSVQLATTFTEEQLKGTAMLDMAFQYEDRFDYQSLEISKKLSDYDVKRYKALYLPTLSLTGAFQENAYNNTYDFFSKTGVWYPSSYAGISLKVPIFSGFSKDANLQKARLQADLVSKQLDDLKQNIDLQISMARNTFLSAIKTMENQKENAALAESVYNQTKKKYESGLASNTDLTNAQTDLIQAQSNYINALYSAVIAKIDYLKAIGKI